MNLFWRLLWLRLVSGRREPCPVLGPCATPFRVVPTDLDVLRHVNNGVYLSLLDLARVDLMTRSALLPLLGERGWYPVVSAETITFTRSLRLLQAFSVQTEIIGWDHKAFFVAQRFVREGQVVASAVVRARFLARTGGSVSTEQVLSLLEDPPAPPVLPGWVTRWSTDADQRGDAPGGTRTTVGAD